MQHHAGARGPRKRTLLLNADCSAADALQLLAPEDSDALLEGRIFVNRRRIHEPDQRLARGDEVTWNAGRLEPNIEVLRGQLVLESRDGLVAAAKPAAWASEPDRSGSATSLSEQLLGVLGIRELHVATRLDVGVSGLVLCATNAEARRYLAHLVGTSAFHRIYLAVVAGVPPERGTWRGSVDAHSGVRARPAVTHFECLSRVSLPQGSTLGDAQRADQIALLTLRPETGRRHQLRIHASRAGFPLVGDRRYQGPARFIDATGRVTAIDRILLHAASTQVPLPGHRIWKLVCPIPEDFQELWRRLGGSAGELNRVLSSFQPRAGA
ncbi:MAG TPA: RNA pseudouridine synthase [Polyangiaceae bacterium]|nr:RNA pseudouridine synthase [Polyangiaceae bacterium]